ncbi:superfamily I DNA/RNA helicase [Catenulispora sp. GP43]|uniref:UvrD-helicase domain-containing protein n=1 Tax=Catenulispora sp. GP43 TaxID=3156263 RepID=UPI0035185427
MSTPSYAPTAEQASAIDAFATGGNVVLQAGAGTGKTSTLRMLAASAPGRRGIYVAYNKAIAEEAKRTFPRTVACGTAHSLAFRAVGRTFAHRLGGPRQPAREVANILNITKPLALGSNLAPLAPQQIARLVVGMVGRFCYSADVEPGRWHLPRVPGLDDRATREHIGEALVPFARAAWADLCRRDGRLRYTHDAYLKIWQLSGPKLDADFLLFDEAQDANPVVADVVEHQGGMQVIAVGDSCQAIYAWRGAEDAMNRFGGTRLTLSQSFRFGPAVAEAANAWLSVLKAPLRLTGYDRIRSRLDVLDRPNAILCRSNAGAVGEAMTATAEGRRAALVGGGNEIRRMAQAAITLKAGAGTDHPELFAFRTWGEVQDYVQHDESGSDLKVFVKLIDSHGPDVVIAACDALAGSEQAADVVISTAHKSKGREWPTVRIADDFHAPSPDEHGKITVNAGEAMLGYVAVTRAQETLDNTGLAWVHTLTGVTR